MSERSVVDARRQDRWIRNALIRKTAEEWTAEDNKRGEEGRSEEREERRGEERGEESDERIGDAHAHSDHVRPRVPAQKRTTFYLHLLPCDDGGANGH